MKLKDICTSKFFEHWAHKWKEIFESTYVTKFSEN